MLQSENYIWPNYIYVTIWELYLAELHLYYNPRNIPGQTTFWWKSKNYTWPNYILVTISELYLAKLHFDENLRTLRWQSENSNKYLAKLHFDDNLKTIPGQTTFWWHSENYTWLQCLGSIKFWCGSWSWIFTEKKWIRIQVLSLRFTEFIVIFELFVLCFSLIFILKLDKPFRNKKIFIIFLFFQKFRFGF